MGNLTEYGHVFPYYEVYFWYYFEFETEKVNLTGNNFRTYDNFYLYLYDSRKEELQVGNVYPIFYDDVNGASLSFNFSEIYKFHDNFSNKNYIPVKFDYGLSISFAVISGSVLLVELIVLYVKFMSFIGRKIRRNYKSERSAKKQKKKQVLTLESVSVKPDLYVLGIKISS